MADTITVTFGEEQFSPHKYHTFRVGPFSMTTEVKFGETAETALIRVTKILKEHSDKMMKAQMHKYFQHLEMLTNAKPKA